MPLLFKTGTLKVRDNADSAKSSKSVSVVTGLDDDRCDNFNGSGS